MHAISSTRTKPAAKPPSQAASSAVPFPGASVRGHRVPKQRAGHRLLRKEAMQRSRPQKQQWLRLLGWGPSKGPRQRGRPLPGPTLLLAWQCAAPLGPRERLGAHFAPLPLLTTRLCTKPHTEQTRDCLLRAHGAAPLKGVLVAGCQLHSPPTAKGNP